MTQSKLIKGLVLMSSSFLVIAFLCYRSGLFANFVNSDTGLQTSPNGSSIQANSVVKLTKPNDSVQARKMLPSSKVMVMADWKNPPSNPGKQNLKPRVLLTEQQIMSSSKSAIMFRQVDSTKYNFNKYKKDTNTSTLK